jgi:transcriptional antiterminator NusG
MSDEYKEIFREMPARRRLPQTFRLGDMVRVLSGPFASFTGKIEGINQSKRLLKVRVEIFGRETPVKLGYAEVEKVSF